MRLWNRNTSNGVSSNGQPQPQNSLVATAALASTSKRRLRESNSIEDTREVSSIKSPKPSAKSKKIDEQTNKKNSTQLVQNHEVVSSRGHSERKGKYHYFFLPLYTYLYV